MTKSTVYFLDRLYIAGITIS